METIATLQILRAIAASVVAYNHAQIFAGTVNTSPAAQSNFFHLNQWGAVGVDVFFVLSGVIITLSAGKIFSKRDAHFFMIKRFLRIAPYYWLISSILMIWTLSRSEQAQYVTIGAIEATYLFYPVEAFPLIGVGWTLCFEMLFYVGMYLVQLYRFCWITVRLAGVVGFWLLCLLYLTEQSARTFFLNPIILEFLLGVAIGFAYLSSIEIKKPLALATLFIGTFALIMTIFTGYGRIAIADFTMSAENSAQRVLLWGIPSALIVASALFLDKHVKRSGLVKVIVFVGDASYSIYLLHQLFFRGLLKAPIIAKIPPDALIILVTFGAIIIGCLSYVCIERPITWFNRRIVRAIS